MPNPPPSMFHISIFYTLLYWRHLKITYLFDPMHIQEHVKEYTKILDWCQRQQERTRGLKNDGYQEVLLAKRNQL